MVKKKKKKVSAITEPAFEITGAMLSASCGTTVQALAATNPPLRA
jgi:hypothetical protein